MSDSKTDVPPKSPKAKQPPSTSGIEVRATQQSAKYSRLDVYWNNQHIGEYERSVEHEIQRKKGEIHSAARILIDVYRKHGFWVVRWDGVNRKKSIWVDGLEVGIIPKEYWGKPSWE